MLEAIMLTKKDFQAIADILLDERSAANTMAELDRIDGIGLAMVGYLATKNPKLDIEKFLKA
jgi:hypothetical protein